MRRDAANKVIMEWLTQLAQRRPYLVLVLGLALLVGWLVVQRGHKERPSEAAETGLFADDVPEEPTPAPTFGPGTYHFCFWNVENLFDDKDDERKARGDAEYDAYFAHDREALLQKLDHLCQVILGINGGRGPDVLAVCEMESERAVELLRRSLNLRLKDPALRYRHLAYEHASGGRNIAPAVLSRLPVDASRTRLVDRKMRIVETQVTVADRPLVVIASHWTSRVTDHTGDRRAVYGDKLHGRYRQIVNSNPEVDLLICGDFNDNPDDNSVTQHLHATGDRDAVNGATRSPMLFNVFAQPWKNGAASHYHGAKPYLFDQICVSPGMLDTQGWSCEVGSASVIREMATRQGRPLRFGGAKDKVPLADRGASDHFPVVVRLQVR